MILISFKQVIDERLEKRSSDYPDLFVAKHKRPLTDFQDLPNTAMQIPRLRDDVGQLASVADVGGALEVRQRYTVSVL